MGQLPALVTQVAQDRGIGIGVVRVAHTPLSVGFEHLIQFALKPDVGFVIDDVEPFGVRLCIHWQRVQGAVRAHVGLPKPFAAIFPDTVQRIDEP
ncbi:hypothetical protein D3C80_1966870 [compost metagenome]